jgi:hypothetical protein
MKILLVLMCYIKYLSGYISYFDAGYFLSFPIGFLCLEAKGIVASTLILSFLEFAGKPGFCLPATFGFLVAFTREGM